MAQAKIGDVVTVHYVGTLDDNTKFDSSYGNEPIKFTIGDKKLIPDFEQSVIGMQPGEKKKVVIVSERAYGPIHNNLIIKVERSKIPPHINPQLGQILHFREEGSGGNPGRAIAFSVIGATDTHLTLDANHPLAGKDLFFEIELIKIF
jgi:peptidylprolyl isomerase